MSHDFGYDVFISYSSKDKEWVRGELLSTLEDRNLRVIIDFRDFQIGAPTIKEIERAILISRKTLLILTPNYLSSQWTEFENLLLQTLDPPNQERRLVPLLKAPCELPLRIRYLNHINFVDPDECQLAWQRLLTALGVAPVPITSDVMPASASVLSASIRFSRVEQVRMQALENRLAVLTEQYTAASRQLASTLSAVDGVKLQHQLDDLVRDIETAEQQLVELRQGHYRLD